MKKIYLVIFTILVCGFLNAQTIVTIDRANGPGPTATGNDPSISSIGFSRGPGVIQRNGVSFSTRNWDGTDQASAELIGDYIEWSVTSNASYDIQITEIDIRLRRNANGPSQIQLLYSLDGFTTAGIPLDEVSTLAANTNTTINIDGLNINSVASGTITFRLYAWNSTTNAGWLRIQPRAVWADYGIAEPGARLIGNIIPLSANSTDSNIVSTAFDPTDNISYSNFSATSGLTTSNAIKVAEFSIQDGGNTLSDADALSTILTNLDLNISNSSSLAALAIFDGSTNISEVTTVTENTSFSGITGLAAADNSSKTFSLYATFNSAVIDNDQFQITITSAVADGASGSIFNAVDAGGAQTSIAGNDNRIEVTATTLAFETQPTDTNLFETMTPFPTLIAVDVNGNLDTDYNGTINVIASGPLDPPNQTYSAVNGVAILNAIVFGQEATGVSLFAFSGSFFSGPSNAFDINGPLITVALQDFDGSTPEWTYTTNIPTFDNGWGIDGYYDVIDIANASPLDYSSFSNNIFGENDLNDEGDNGTTGFATLTFSTIDVSTYENIILSFDWQVIGFNTNSDDVRYRIIYDGVAQPNVFLLDGNFPATDGQGTVRFEIPDGVNTVGLEIDVRNNGLNEYSGFDNFKLVSVFDGLLYANNGWSPNQPSNSTGSENVYIYDGTYIIGSNIQANNFYVNSIGATSISSGQSLVANSSIINNGLIEMNSVSTSYSSLISDNVQGKVTYNRHVNQFADSGSSTGANDLISAPVTDSNQTFLAFRNANPDIPSGTIEGVPSFLFGPFDNSTNEYINYTPANDASVLNFGIGYRTASDTPTGSTFEFTGDVLTSTITTPITVGSASIFNLVGNPFSSYIRLSDFLADNNSEFSIFNSGVYGYDGAALDGFTIWNQAYSDANPTAKIAPGQGFLLASKAGGGTITFDANSRTTGTTDDFIVGRNALDNLAHLKLQLSRENALYKTDVYFNDNATLGMDPGYDSGLVGGQAPAFAIYSHLVENNSGMDLGVQSVQYDAVNNVIIPLGVNANQGEQLTISILENDVPDNVDVYLEDTVDNTFTLLNTSDFVITPSTNLSGTGRFFLRFSSEALSTQEATFETVQIYTTKSPKSLFIKGLLDQNTTLEIYDIQGRMILKSKLDTRSNSNEVDISEFTTGVYIVKLNNGSQQKSQKVIIN
ncbi:T9SS type A sorting domain-containing protein [Psychroserpens sp. Hel_I_66]|uniref:T9SS type A sorting domain-containing protein n=1 Tax=Psychroserpens sp. Hel_I_66 TaxID=1250004 RepID=UPI000646D7C9|nr:T9SS type A sorting domain-containing protein [Psychroserpens sp. Hel_I_66]